MNRNAAIHKFHIRPGSPESLITEVEMPQGAQIIRVGVQGRNTLIWAIVNPNEKETVQRRFKVVPTGLPFEHKASDTYLGTLDINDSLFGVLVLHVFEVL